MLWSKDMSKKYLSLLIVVLAGEAIFMHPFLVPRLYRNLMMDAWGISNTDVGVAFSAYGITAMLSYILGGPFADKYDPRGLMVISLLATALGSCLLLFNPSATTLTIAYGFFGVSTIFLMWSAMIKLTHEIGGEQTRSTAMAVLEGGRGFVAAAMGSFLVFLVGMQSEGERIIDKTASLNSIYISISVFMVIFAVIVWFGLKDVESAEAKTHNWSFAKAKVLLKDLNLWLLSIIILSAYCSYKNVGNYPVYLRDIKGMSIIESSEITSYIFWLRPICALMAGIFADKLTLKVAGGRFITLIILFALALVTQLALAADILPGMNLILFTILSTSAMAYAIRAIYFAVFGEFKISDTLIGTATGIVSLVGFMPDFFFGIATGYLIDEFPGALGFSYVFYLNSAFLFLGTIASWFCYRAVARP
jgi:MFS family permease